MCFFLFSYIYWPTLYKYSPRFKTVSPTTLFVERIVVFYCKLYSNYYFYFCFVSILCYFLSAFLNLFQILLLFYINTQQNFIKVDYKFIKVIWNWFQDNKFNYSYMKLNSFYLSMKSLEDSLLLIWMNHMIIFIQLLNLCRLSFHKIILKNYYYEWKINFW